MKNYFQSLNEREKWMVIATAVCVFFYIYYYMLYAPLSNKVTTRQSQLVEKSATLKWMQQVKTTYKAHGARITLDNNQLLSVIDRALKEDSAFEGNYQLQQTQAGDIQISFTEVPFKIFMDWLGEFNKKYQFNIRQLDASESKTPGVVSMTVTLGA